MIRAYVTGPHGTEAVDDIERVAPHQVIWVDLERPAPEEVAAVEARFASRIPNREQRASIEVSSRLVAGAEAITASFTALASDPHAATARAVTAILTDRRIITVRQHAALGFDVVERRLLECREPMTSRDIFLAIVEANTDLIADRLEEIGAAIEATFAEVLSAETRTRRSGGRVRRLFTALGHQGSHLLNVQDSLMSLERLTVFMGNHAGRVLPVGTGSETLAALGADLRSLADFAAALASKVEFLLNAMLGLVQLDQNQIMKSMSLIAAMFLPATLMSSVFGMNFHDMPVLSWRHGFLIALGAMALTALAAAAVFRWRRWM